MRLNWWKWTLICAGVLAVTELLVLGMIPLFGESWYYREPGWHTDLLNAMLVAFAVTEGTAWLAVLPALVVRDIRKRHHKNDIR